MNKNTAAVIAQLTVKGREAMTAIGQHKVSYFDDGIVEGSGSWGSCLTEDLGHKSSGVLNRLEALGLFTTTDTGEPEDAGFWWELTDLGADVANTLAGNTADEDNTEDNTEEGTTTVTDTNETPETPFAVSTSRDGSRKVHKVGCKKQPKNSIAATTSAMYADATAATCCKPKFAEWVEELREAEKAAAEEPVTVRVNWTPNVAKLFFRALAKDGTKMIAEALGVQHKSNETHLWVELTGDALTVCELAEQLPGFWEKSNEELREWRKTSPEYKQHDLRTKEGAKAGFLAEQDLLRAKSATAAHAGLAGLR